MCISGVGLFNLDIYSIWHPNPPRFALATFQLLLPHGGLPLPNLHLYYFAAQLVYSMYTGGYFLS